MEGIRLEDLVKPLCPITLGNVEFWVDESGPWAGELAFSLPQSAWDKDAVTRDLTEALVG